MIKKSRNNLKNFQTRCNFLSEFPEKLFPYDSFDLLGEIMNSFSNKPSRLLLYKTEMVERG